MTAIALIRKLEEAIKKHGPRVRVTLDLNELKDSVKHLDDGYTYWETNCFSIEHIPWAVDGSFQLQNGSDRTKTVVVIS